MTPSQQPANTAESGSQVEIRCPECAALYRVAAHLSGRRFQCRRCNHVWRWGDKQSPGTSSSGAARTGSDSRISSLSDLDGLPTAGAGSSVIDMSWAGRKLGRYRLQTVLGRGGMGVVWKAHDPTLHRDVAVKILNLPTSSDGGQSLTHLLFLQEARAAARLNHPGAITVFEVAEDAGHAFIAMELMHEGTLRDRVERAGPIEPRELFALMAGPARALALGHARGILHRDVKPGNLMFDDQGRLKLGDFGLSEVAGDPTSLRMRGRAVGSLGWVAPETARGEPTTTASDIYAFGLVLLYALTGRPWLHADSRSQLLKLHQSPPELEAPEVPGLSDDGRALLYRCLAKDPADRFKSAEELATFLEHCAREADEPVELVEQVRRSQRRTIAVGALVTVATIALAALMFWSYLGKELREIGRPLQSRAPMVSPATKPLPTPAPSPQTKARAPAPMPAPTPAPAAAPAKPAPAAAKKQTPPGAKQAPREPDPSRCWPGKLDEATLHYVASRNGRVYHLPSCEGGRQIYLSNLTNYLTAREAEAAGKKPCPYCHPDPPGGKPPAPAGGGK